MKNLTFQEKQNLLSLIRLHIEQLEEIEYQAARRKLYGWKREVNNVVKLQKEYKKIYEKISRD